jgi:hypothetical protein
MKHPNHANKIFISKRAERAYFNVLMLFYPKYPFTGRICARKYRRAKYWNRILCREELDT